MEIINKGYLVISLDFELLWGVFDKISIDERKEYFINTKNLIPEILNLFSEFEIHATWATVGMLFNNNWKEWEINTPKKLPNYANKSLSAYTYGNSINKAEMEEFCFAKDLIQIVQLTANQEIATHTYSHYYCLEEGQTLQSFEADLKQCLLLAKEMGIELKSLVFPRNQYNEQYLKICYENGIENVRSNPINWYWDDVKNNSLKSKIFRTGDAYLGRNDKSYNQSELIKENEKPLSQKASRLLRPYSSNKFLNNLKLKRIKSEMGAAAENNQIYHLWWHPHNFGNNSEENMRDLRSILEHFNILKNKFDFQSKTMAEINKMV